MSKLNVWGVVLVMVLAGSLVTPALGFDQPLINLGFTSFMDGGPPSGPGHYFTQYFQYMNYYKLPDHGGSPKAGVDIWGSLSQYIYQSDQPVFLGGKWGLDVILPAASIDSWDSQAIVRDNGCGFGDLWVGPYIQWDPIMGNEGPTFMHRIEFQTIWPTGDYDTEKGLNQGSNFFSFNPYWAATSFLTPRWTASCRVHWLWNDKNGNPYTGPGGTAVSNTQAGQVFHMNFASSYEVEPKKLRLGVNGYYMKQITDSKTDGASVDGREQVLGIGPGALYSLSPNTHLFLNAYYESHVRYRGKGSRYTFRVVHHFD